MSLLTIRLSPDIATNGPIRGNNKFITLFISEIPPRWWGTFGASNVYIPVTEGYLEWDELFFFTSREESREILTPYWQQISSVDPPIDGKSGVLGVFMVGDLKCQGELSRPTDESTKVYLFLLAGFLEHELFF